MNISYHDARYILDLQESSTTQKLLLFALLTHMHPGTKKIHPSYGTLGKELMCDAKTVMRNIKALRNKGLLQIRKEMHAGRKCNAYVVPFSDGYAYKSEQNDPSVPKPAPKPKPNANPDANPDAKPDANPEPDNEAWMNACRKIVYTTPIPSVFVDIMFEDLEQMDFIDALGKRITPRTLQSHIARMWKHCNEKPFYTNLEKVWDEFWANCSEGLYNDENGNRDVKKENAALAQLEDRYGVDWDNTDPGEYRHAPNLGFNPEYHFYADKYEIREENNVKEPPLNADL